MSINWPAVGFTIFPNLGGFVNGYITKDNIKTWYRTLNRPKLCPPDWIFGPVWTSLYSGMGYASYMVFRDGGGFNGNARLPLIAFGTNLALNWAWTPIFFGQHNLKLAFYEINLINASAMAAGYMFYQINPAAGYMMIPYVLWVSFATYLSYGFYKKNPDQPKAKITELKDN